jgi:hypothetical protein
MKLRAMREHNHPLRMRKHEALITGRRSGVAPPEGNTFSIVEEA